MKLLVLASAPVGAAALREALGSGFDPNATEVLVLAPALVEGPVQFWLSDTDEAIERAQAVRGESVRELSAEGVSATGRTGESDPVQAVADALQTFPAERIVLALHAEADSQRYREDVEEAELRERFGLPVDRVELRG
jgi:hypothetical protein